MNAIRLSILSLLMATTSGNAAESPDPGALSATDDALIRELEFTVARTSPDSVLVTYRAQQDTLCGGARVPSPVWATSLYVKRAGRWVNVLYQHTPAAGG